MAIVSIVSMRARASWLIGYTYYRYTYYGYTYYGRRFSADRFCTAAAARALRQVRQRRDALRRVRCEAIR